MPIKRGDLLYVAIRIPKFAIKNKSTPLPLPRNNHLTILFSLLQKILHKSHSSSLLIFSESQDLTPSEDRKENNKTNEEKMKKKMGWLFYRTY
jgi:hypothetical protein